METRLIQMYWGFGLKLQAIDNPLESGVVKVWERMHSGRSEGVRFAVALSGRTPALST